MLKENKICLAPCQGDLNDPAAPNADAVQHCKAIGCGGGDCDGGIINCFDCLPQATQKIPRAAADGKPFEFNI